MNINVPEWARARFWDDPPPETIEFWAFGFPPPCRVGEELFFRFDGVPVARAVVLRVEEPGASTGADGRFRHRWKVFWEPESFRDLRVPPRGDDPPRTRQWPCLAGCNTRILQTELAPGAGVWRPLYCDRCRAPWTPAAVEATAPQTRHS